ncbi:hypothetical protein D0861_06491 [Hortaea werneckii]|uniref:Uncharacterized protein n=1 Tax=Hortaea werneckii TaxID=91943 RepID=A0A3M7F9Q6_HORWE|nr:hypothetical protein D0861_06491 [Hortaea werneckii]
MTASSNGNAHVVNIASEGLIARWKRCGQSKLAQVLYTFPPAQRCATLSISAVHSGVVGTDLVKTLGIAGRLLVYATSTVVTPEDGCKNPVWGAIARRQSVENGAYHSPVAEPGK